MTPILKTDRSRILAFLTGLRIAAAVWFFLAAFVDVAGAHEIRPAVVTVTFDRQVFDIEISANVEAMIARVSPKHADTSESPNAQRYDMLRQLSSSALEEKIHEFAPELAKGLAIEIDGERGTPKLIEARVDEGSSDRGDACDLWMPRAVRRAG